MLTSRVLQLSTPELEQMIEQELVENPALECTEPDEDPIAETEVLKVVAPAELKPSSSDPEFRRSLPDADEAQSWVELVACNDSLSNHLRGQLLPMVSDELRDLADYLIGSVNERGYLTCSVEEAALDCGRSLEEAEQVLEFLRSCEPAGVGASDLRECLLLQLRRPETGEEKLARCIVRDHWDMLVSRSTRALSRIYKVVPDLIDAAFDVVCGLNPFPGEFFDGASTAPASERPALATPDLVLTLAEVGWTVQVCGAGSRGLRVSRSYQAKYCDQKTSWQTSPGEKRHVREYVDRACRFIEAIEQRDRLMAEIGRKLLEQQAGFVSTGEYRFLRPLTRSRLARELDVHESTVSRATNGKFVQIANGEVVPFDVFFKPALRIERMIQEILQHENPDAPLSDESIATTLRDMGVQVARRTVNKYRDRSKLLSSRRRKSA